MKENLMKLLNELEKERNYHKIITVIEALSDEDKNSKIKLSLAKAYNHIDKFNKTIKILESIKDSENNTSIWNYCMGHSYYYLDNFSEAERYLLKALEINLEDKPSNFLLALLYHELGDIEEPEEAIHYLNKSLDYFNAYSKLDAEEDIIEDLISIEQKLAWNYNKLRNHKEAEIHLRKAISLGDNEEWVYSQLAYNLRSQERYEEALENYHRVLMGNSPVSKVGIVHIQFYGWWSRVIDWVRVDFSYWVGFILIYIIRIAFCRFKIIGIC